MGVEEPLPNLTIGRYHHACGKFLNDDGVAVSITLSVDSPEPRVEGAPGDGGSEPQVRGGVRPGLHRDPGWRHLEVHQSSPLRQVWPEGCKCGQQSLRVR